MPTKSNQVAPSPSVDDILVNHLKPVVLITSAIWKEGTNAGLLARRPAEFVAVDEALDTYQKYKQNTPALDNLRRAYNDLVQKLPDSQRNPELISLLGWQIRSAKAYVTQEAVVNRANNPQSNAAVDSLIAVSHHSITRNLIDPKCLLPLKDNPNAAITLSFRKIILKEGSTEAIRHLADIANINTAAVAIKKSIKKPVEDPAAEFKNKFAELASGISMSELFSGEEAAKTFFEAASTVLGTVAAPIALVTALVGWVTDTYSVSSMKDSRSAFSIDPKNGSAAAFDSLLKMMQRDAANKKMEVAKAALSLGSLAIPVAGPAIGAALNGIISVAIRTKLISIERQEMALGQKLLSEGKTEGLFEVCPLLGCYFLALADHAVLLNWAPPEDIYADNFMDSIEVMANDAEPAIERARQYIIDSPFALEGTQGLKGLEWYVTWRNNRLKYLASVLTMSSFLKLFSKTTMANNALNKKELIDAYYPMLAHDAAFLSQLDSDQSTDAMPAVGHTLAGHADDVKALRADSNVETPADDLYGNVGQDFAAVDKALTPTRTSKTTGIEVNTFGKATLNAWQAGVDGGSDDILDKDGNKIEDKTVGKDGQSQSTARPGEMG